MNKHRIKWQFLFTRSEFVNTMENGKLAAKLDNIPHWFMPENESWTTIGLGTFCRHVRELAIYHGVKTVSVKIMNDRECSRYVLFRRCYLFKKKYKEETDQSRNNIYYFYYKHYTTNEGDKLYIHTEIINESTLLKEDGDDDQKIKRTTG